MEAIPTAAVLTRPTAYAGSWRFDEPARPVPRLRPAPEPSELETLLAGTEAAMIQALGSPSAINPNSNQAAASVAAQHLQCGGRRVRARLALTASLALGVPAADAIAVAAASELLHNASLVHDDLQDRDETRRGAPTVWRAHGDDLALCSGDLLLSAAYGVLAAVGRPALLPALLAALHEATREAIEGQCADRAACNTAGIECYRQIVIAKSGAMLALPLRLALLAGDAGSAYGQARAACDAFAMGYQIADDLADLERDARACRGGALNVVLVLQAAGAGATGPQQAQQLGRQYLDTARKETLGLPADCGVLLRELAQQLIASLGQTSMRLPFVAATGAA